MAIDQKRRRKKLAKKAAKRMKEAFSPVLLYFQELCEIMRI